MKKFEIREGDGNSGEYHRGFVEAPDAFKALRLASRRRIIWKPRTVTLASIEGDDQSAYLADYTAPIFGDACRWTASATLRE